MNFVYLQIIFVNMEILYANYQILSIAIFDNFQILFVFYLN